MLSRWLVLGVAAVVVICAATDRTLAGPGPCACDTDVNNIFGTNPVDVAIVTDCTRLGSCGGCVSSCDVDCDGDVDYYDVGVVACAFQGAPSPCTAPAGACTGAGINLPPCILTTEHYCAGFTSGTYHGDGTICVGNNAVDVPAASTWGLVAMSLGTMIAATIVLRKGVRATRGVR